MTQNILELLKEKRYGQLRQLLSGCNPVDIAALFDEIDRDEGAAMLFRLLPKDTAADVFSYLSSDSQERLIGLLSDKELGCIIDDMYLDDAADLVEEMPANVVDKVLRVAGPDTRVRINQLLKYPQDSAGSVMTTEFVDLKREMTVKECFDHIRKHAIDKETIYTCYVLDQTRKLSGVVTVKDLLLAPYETRVADLMDENVIYVSTLDDQEAVANLFQKYDMLSLPVVDQERRLVGIITVDDAMDVMQEENTEDFEKMAAIQPMEDTYLHTPVFTHARKRIVWLLVLMVSAVITGGIISRFENAIAVVPLLVTFIPMLMDTGGNAGSQASTLIIRGMALGEIQWNDFFRVLFKEFRISLVVGGVLSVVDALWIWAVYHSLPVALTVGISLFVTVCVAKMVGCALPMTAKRLGLDPAIMASPLLTTVVDGCAILVYFNVAAALMHL